MSAETTVLSSHIVESYHRQRPFNRRFDKLTVFYHPRERALAGTRIEAY